MIIVTGGAGFIGSCLVAGLAEAGLGPLVVVDALGEGQKWRNIAKRQLHAVLPPTAILPYLEEHASEVSLIYHMGAISATTATDADAVVANNFTLSQQLWQFCATHRKRFIYASSAATYGDGSQGFVDHDTPAQLAALKPLNLYGWSKHLFDRWIAAQSGWQRPSQCVGLKFFNVYGPNEYHKEGQRSVVHQIFPIAQAGEAFSLFKSHHPNYTDGGQLRDFIWVEDCVKVMLWLRQQPKVSGLFNVGTGQARSFADLATAVYRACGQSPRITFRDMPENIRPNYQYFTQADMSKLRQAGYTQPFTSLEDGINQYIKNYLQQPDIYR